jgi:hypothetical protein
LAVRRAFDFHLISPVLRQWLNAGRRHYPALMWKSKREKGAKSKRLAMNGPV